MINLSELEPTSIETTVTPSNNIFEELGRNTYDYKDLLSELIDNCIAARREGVTLEVVIDIYVDANGKAQKFVIRDNAKGIPQDKFGVAISPAGSQSLNSLNEHGLGMKQAVAALGKLDYLATKTELCEVCNRSEGDRIQLTCGRLARGVIEGMGQRQWQRQ